MGHTWGAGGTLTWLSNPHPKTDCIFSLNYPLLPKMAQISASLEFPDHESLVLQFSAKLSKGFHALSQWLLNIWPKQANAAW